MPLPLRTQVHTDALLTDISVAYKQSATNFIAGLAAPEVGVQKQSDLYRVYTKNDWMRDELQLRGPGTESARVGYNLSTSAYYCDVWSASEIIGEQMAANFDQPGDPYVSATEHLTQLALIRRERKFATDCFATSVWGTDVTLSGTDQWSDPVGSDPKEDVHTGQLAVLTSTGFMPNTMVVGFAVHQALQRHPLVREQFKYTSAESINEAMLARFFEVDRYLVMKAAYASNFENAAHVGAMIGGKHCLLAYIAPNPGIMTPSAMYTFNWAGLVGGNSGVRISRFERPELAGEQIEITLSFDHVLTGTDLGYFIASAVA